MKQKELNSSTFKTNMLLAWFYWFICGCFYFYQFSLRVVPNVASADLMRDFNMTASTLGSVGFWGYLSYTIFQVPSGIFIDRFGTKKMMIGAVFLCAISTYIFANTESILILNLMRALTGIGSSFAFVCCVKVTSEWFPPRLMSTVLSITILLGASGGVFGIAGMKWLIEHYHWRNVMEALGMLGMGLILLTCILKENNPENTSNQEGPVLSLKNIIEQLWAAFQNSQIILIFFFAFCIYLPLSMIGDSWGNAFMKNVYGPEYESYSSLLYMGVIAGSAIYAFVTARIDQIKILLFSVAIPQALLCAFLVWGGDFIRPFVGYVLFLIGLFNGGQMLMYTLATLNASPRLSASVSSLINMGTMVSGVIFIKLFGVLLDFLWQAQENHELINGVRVYSASSYQWAMSILPIAGFVAVFLLLFIKNKQTTR